MKTNLVTHPLHNIINISKIATIGYWELAQDFNCEDECFLNTWKLTYVDMGEIIATTGEKEFLLKSGDVIFNKPNETHCLRTNNLATNTVVITFVCHSPILNCLHKKSIHLNAQQRKLIAWILEESEGLFESDMAAEGLQKNKSTEVKNIPGREQMVRIHLEHLLILLIRGEQQDLSFSFNHDNFNNKLVNQIVQFLEENICNNITLEDVCEKFNYGNTYICTLFKEETGYSIMNYYTKKKIDLAKKILRESLLNITQVSDYLNFCNPHYFSHVFKKYVHMSPREYQQSVQSDVASVMVKRS